MTDIEDLIDQLDAEEKQGLEQRFVAPVIAGSKVTVRIAGIVYELSVKGELEPGFYVLQPEDRHSARVVRACKKREAKAYLELFVQARVVLVDQVDDVWFGLQAVGGTQRLTIEGLVPVQLCEGAGRFDQVLARFDGKRLWFEGRDRRRERAVADYLRTSFGEELPADELDRKGLTPQERQAYALAQIRDKERRGQTVEERLREALSHAGGQLASFIEHADRYQVVWNVGGQRYASAIGKDDLTVMVAGICLSGQDRHFDLQSLVGVMREAQGDVLRIGDGGMDVGRYFEIHPEDRPREGGQQQQQQQQQRGRRRGRRGRRR
ncbi:MAG: hypothetical protein KC503_31880 [Myxococcales bacterium]|nr:hypothetical protein [Myxococcales bacterium]